MTSIIKNTRHYCLVLIAGASLFLTGSCFSNRNAEDGPEDIVKNFLAALNAGDFDTAESYCNPIEMKGYLDNILSAWESNEPDIAKILPDILSETEINVTQVTKSGDFRTVFYTLTAKDGRQKEKAATLGKNEGKWEIKAITDRH